MSLLSLARDTFNIVACFNDPRSLVFLAECCKQLRSELTANSVVSKALLSHLRLPGRESLREQDIAVDNAVLWARLGTSMCAGRWELQTLPSTTFLATRPQLLPPLARKSSSRWWLEIKLSSEWCHRCVLYRQTTCVDKITSRGDSSSVEMDEDGLVKIALAYIAFHRGTGTRPAYWNLSADIDATTKKLVATERIKVRVVSSISEPYTVLETKARNWSPAEFGAGFGRALERAGVPANDILTQRDLVFLILRSMHLVPD